MNALLSLLGLALQLQGVTLPPPPRGFSPTEADMVVDQAGVLSADAIARMNRMIFAVKSQSGGEIVVVTLRDIGGREAGDVALQLGRAWKVGEGTQIGNQSRNAGLVVLLVPRESASDGRGQISITTGQGTEGFITDGTAGDIRREATDYFRQQDYSAGVELITQRVAQRYAGNFGFSLDSALLNPRFEERFAGSGRSGEISPVTLLIILIILMFVFSAMARTARSGGGRGCLNALIVEAITSPRRRGGYHGGWGGGGFGGGSWGGGGGFGGFGGGGGFSGGGSSGSW